ncbi:gliding motility-associated protein GldM [Mucilaginibacter gracilis]|uniref:Gliding motility-associated protein GldM n=1 Tax=Mucilaginibacter gracilis TaxID=423350 RepID=A0A495IWE9_9SPHI|nr:gliding motility protein GldM [Mucilaginibacter gracilis]RKR80833.1 gliding motility-associated protein GldM [Mucilaginibacter gracilis]
MAAGKQTPRQRMINILYLVLLGLIALNVPENLLDAFKKIGDSLSTSTKNVQSSIDQNYTAFEKHLKDEPEKAKPIYAKAQTATALAKKLYDEVEELKTELVKNSGGMDEATGDYKGRDDMEASERLMIKNEKGAQLRKDILETRSKLLDLVDPKDRAAMSLSLDAQAPPHANGVPEKSWEEAYFGPNIPVAAVMTTLIKIQSDAKNDESAVTKKLLSKFDQAVVNLDKFEAVAVAPTSYVIVGGQPYTAQVFLTASDSHSVPYVTVGGSKLPIVDGKGVYTGSTSSEGIKTWTGTITVKQTDGTVKTYTTAPQTYQVAKPSAVVSPDKMNVLYTGVSNPLSVSAPGIPVEKLHVTISGGGGSLSGSNGHYEAKVTSIGEATVNISAELVKGKVLSLGSTKFRVKRIPDPKAQFGGKSGGSSPAVNLRAQEKLFAKLENFEFDAKFVVKSFKLFVAKPHQDAVVSTSNSAELSPAQKLALSSITPGSTVYFDDIVAVGPDGSQRALDPIIFKAQ